jgi:hypothetical protein
MLRASLGKVVHTVKTAGTYAAKVPHQELHKIAVHVQAVGTSFGSKYGSFRAFFVLFLYYGEKLFYVSTSVADPNPDPPDPRVFGPPGSGSTSQRYGSGSCSGSFIIMQK